MTAPTTAEAAYRAALALYRTAQQHTTSVDLLTRMHQQGRPLEMQDPDVWADQERSWRRADQAKNALIDTAPEAPTGWWPGGWQGFTRDRAYGISGLPGQVPDLNVWRTLDQAHTGRPDYVPADEWLVRWTPTADRSGIPGTVVLDESFWQAQDALTPPAPAPRPGRVRRLGAAIWSGPIWLWNWLRGTLIDRL